MSNETVPFVDGMFPHQCEEEGCIVMVNWDDEPKCFLHSPKGGSHVAGYSAKARKEVKENHPAYEPPTIEEIVSVDVVERNVFENPSTDA